jgi:hypothetical protein
VCVETNSELGEMSAIPAEFSFGNVYYSLMAKRKGGKSISNNIFLVG